MTERRTFLIQSLSLAALASGCASQPAQTTDTLLVPNSVAVLGVVQREGLKIPVNEYRLAADLQGMLREAHRHSVMPVDQVRLGLGKSRHDLLLQRVGSYGTLSQPDLRMLKKANLPVRMAVVLVITGNDVQKMNKERLQLRDNGGKLLNDREHVILSTSRSVSMSATLVDLGLGRVRMHNDFTYESVERKRYLEYDGSSFTGTVAARLANTVANGINSPEWPEPPGLYGSFYELLNDVAEELPIA